MGGERPSVDAGAREAIAQILEVRAQEVMLSAAMYARQYYSIILSHIKSGNTFYEWHTHTVAVEFDSVINSRYSTSIEVYYERFSNTGGVDRSETNWTIKLQPFTNEFDSTETRFESLGIHMELTKISNHMIHMEFLVALDMILDDGMKVKDSNDVRQVIITTILKFLEIDPKYLTDVQLELLHMLEEESKEVETITTTTTTTTTEPEKKKPKERVRRKPRQRVQRVQVEEPKTPKGPSVRYRREIVSRGEAGQA